MRSKISESAVLVLPSGYFSADLKLQRVCSLKAMNGATQIHSHY